MDARALDRERMRLLAEAVESHSDQVAVMSGRLDTLTVQIDTAVKAADRAHAAVTDSWSGLIREAFRASVKTSPWMTWMGTLAAVIALAAISTLPATEAAQVVGSVLHLAFGIPSSGASP